jgi:hydroxypyruvate reductase
VSIRNDALTILKAALRAADAGNAVRKRLPQLSRELQPKNFQRVFLISAGKAALPMAEAVVETLGRHIYGGVVVTKHGHLQHAMPGLECFESAHPVPDERGVAASQSIEAILRELNASDLLICAVSGGASALVPAPVEGMSLADKQGITDSLLKAGATIHELNTVRKHLSRLKGGRLAQLAYPATVLSLILSDVIGNDLEVIGSGLTAPDPSTLEDAREIMKKFGLVLPDCATETPKPGDPIFKNVHNVIVGSSRIALDAAAKQAKALGYRPMILSSTMQGETREVARVHAQILREVRTSGNPIKAPACILSGGETTVTVRGKGKGGRNQEFALAAAIEIAGLRNVLVLSAGTDGTDGPTDAAGAIATGTTLKRGPDAPDYLNRNDSYSYFNELDDLVKTGPTGTNVMDVHLLLIEAE